MRESLQRPILLCPSTKKCGTQIRTNAVWQESFPCAGRKKKINNFFNTKSFLSFVYDCNSGGVEAWSRKINSGPQTVNFLPIVNMIRDNIDREKNNKWNKFKICGFTWCFLVGVDGERMYIGRICLTKIMTTAGLLQTFGKSLVRVMLEHALKNPNSASSEREDSSMTFLGVLDAMQHLSTGWCCELAIKIERPRFSLQPVSCLSFLTCLTKRAWQSTCHMTPKILRMRSQCLVMGRERSTF